MDPTFQNALIPAIHLLAVRPEPTGQYTALVVNFPEIRAVAATEQEALEQAKQKLTEWLATTRLVQVKVEVPPSNISPHPFAGQFDPNDPMEQAYLEELARLKREDLENTLREYDQECPNSSSTPTT